MAVASADMNGDGYSDLLIGDGENETIYDFGANPATGPPVFCHKGLFPNTEQLDMAGQQISTLNRPSQLPLNQFRLRVPAFSPAGRTMVRLEYEVKPVGTPFLDEETILTDWFDTGPESQGQSVHVFDITITPTTTGPMKYRARILTKDPVFPASRWLYPPENGYREADLCLLP